MGGYEALLRDYQIGSGSIPQADMSSVEVALKEIQHDLSDTPIQRSLSRLIRVIVAKLEEKRLSTIHKVMTGTIPRDSKEFAKVRVGKDPNVCTLKAVTFKGAIRVYICRGG